MNKRPPIHNIYSNYPSGDLLELRMMVGKIHWHRQLVDCTCTMYIILKTGHKYPPPPSTSFPCITRFEMPQSCVCISNLRKSQFVQKTLLFI